MFCNVIKYKVDVNKILLYLKPGYTQLERSDSMNSAVKITDKVYWVGVNDKETDIFESLWPLPKGVSYNAYLINDEKVAIIDTVKITYHDNFINKIKEVLGDKEVDYLVINHMEPDHSGSIKALKSTYPRLEIIGNVKTREYLQGFYGISDGVKVVEEGDSLKLGEHQLAFSMTPMLHWPETMMSFETKEGILFSGDAFGGFGALEGGIFDDELDIKEYESEIRRYYANIVGRYSPMVQKAFNKLNGLNIRIIASTHGPIWRENPDYIINTYKRYSNYEAEKGVVIVYGTMYGNTKKIAENIARALAENGIKRIKLYDASRTHISYILSEIWNYRGLIIGGCTYNTELFPAVKFLTEALQNRNLKNRLLGIFGSYTWSSGAVKELRKFSEKVQMDLIEPVIEARQAPSKAIIKETRELADNFARAFHKLK